MAPAPPTDLIPAALLDCLIDHAALFPPARLPLDEAVSLDRRLRGGPHGYLLGAFVCPSSRLDELAGALEEHERLPVSAVVEDARVPRPTDPRVYLRMLELAMTADEALEALQDAPPGLPAYVEVPHDDLERDLDTLSKARADGRPVGAKVRCGGASVPSDAELASFVTACADRGLPLKATQGLHHAIRTEQEHGFLNLLLACAVALEGGDVRGVLAERSAPILLTAVPDEETARRMRQDLLVSYGSCSVEEPVAALQSLGVLA